MARRPGIFPTFFLSGFECSTFLWGDEKRRRNLVAETGHDRHAADLQAVCLFPAVDMPDWHSGEWVHNGICDVVPDNGDLQRVPDQEYIDELRRWQKELNRVTRLDADPFSDPVELQDVIDAAHRLDMKPDKNWC